MRSLALNLRLYPLYLCLTWEGISNAVWYLYLFSFKGMSLGQMAWLVLLGDGIIVLAEVPTGWVADRIGRRTSILLGIILQAISALLFIYGNDFWTFWLAMAVCGLGDTFRSGADEALLYDSCRGSGRQLDYRRILARSLAIATVAMVCAQLLGGVLATRVGWTVPFWIELGMSFLGFLVVLAMLEAPYRDEHEGKPPRKADGIPLLGGIIRMLPLLAFAALIAVVPELAHFHLPAELDSAIGISPEQLAILYAGFELAQGLGNWLAGRLKLPRPAITLAMIAAGLLGGMLLMGSRVWLGLAVYIIGRAAVDFLSGIAQPIVSEQANLLTSSSVRATTLSVLNAVSRLLPLSLLPLSATLMLANGPWWTYAMLAVSLVLPLVISLVWLNSRLHTVRESNHA